MRKDTNIRAQRAFERFFFDITLPIFACSFMQFSKGPPLCSRSSSLSLTARCRNP